MRIVRILIQPALSLVLALAGPVLWALDAIIESIHPSNGW